MMSHNKRPAANLKFSREKKSCQQEDEDGQQTSEHTAELYLSLLPNEILLKIFSYLSPVDIVSIVNLNDERLSESTYTVRQANFSVCRKANPVIVSTFFSKDRVKLIQVLNFNYYFYLKPQELTNFICRCKNLKSLFVVGCGLNYNHIYRILQNCKQLEALAWNTTVIPQMKDHDDFPNLKKLYLFHVYPGDFIYNMPILKHFPGLEYVWLYFDYDCNNTLLPFVDMWSMVSTFSNEEKSRHLMIMANQRIYKENFWVCNMFMQICREFIQHLFDGKYLTKPRYDERLFKSYTTALPPYIQIRSDDEDIQSLCSSRLKVCTNLLIIVTDDFLEVSESLVKCVQEIAGDKLECLSFLAQGFKNLDELGLDVMEREEYIFICDKICDVTKKIFLTSKHITVLNLTTVHVGTNSPAKAITQLENLRVLNLPSCAIRNKNRENDSEELSSIVSACAKIEEFVLYCCSESATLLTSDDLVCIQNWSCLKHLSVFYLSTVLRSFAFLKRVADSCIRLLSLTLIGRRSKAASMFVNDVIYLLKKAKSLNSIRINDNKFNPMFERFWPAIGEALNLESICIVTRHSAHVSTREVINGIRKLKYLHTFHFCAENVPSSLWKEIKKSMQDQGIENITCKSKCYLPNVMDFSLTPTMEEIFHNRPYSSECMLQHLKDFDIF